LAKLGIAPELPRAEPMAVEHLGGFKFKIGEKEVELGMVYVKGGYEFYAVLRLSSAEEAVRFAASLRVVGVDAKIASNAVKLDGYSFFGLLVAAGAVSPSLTLLYRSDKDDFHVYACVEEGRMRFFVVRQEGVGRRWEAEQKTSVNPRPSCPRSRPRHNAVYSGIGRREG